jgi:hypothetical protein
MRAPAAPRWTLRQAAEYDFRHVLKRFGHRFNTAVPAETGAFEIIRFHGVRRMTSPARTGFPATSQKEGRPSGRVPSSLRILCLRHAASPAQRVKPSVNRGNSGIKG